MNPISRVLTYLTQIGLCTNLQTGLRCGLRIACYALLCSHAMPRQRAHWAVTKRNWMPFHLKMRLSPQIRGVTRGRGGVYKPPGNCAITRCARTTRQSQLLLTDIRLMIVCAALKRPDVILTWQWRAIVVFTSLWRSCENRLECGGECVVSGVRIIGKTAPGGGGSREGRGRGRARRVLAKWVSRADDL